MKVYDIRLTFLSTDKEVIATIETICESSKTISDKTGFIFE